MATRDEKAAEPQPEEPSESGYTIEMEPLLMTNVSPGGSAGDAESVALNFGDIETTYGEGAAAADSDHEDLNIGVGELQECTVSKSMDLDPPALEPDGLAGPETAEPVSASGDRDAFDILSFEMGAENTVSPAPDDGASGEMGFQVEGDAAPDVIFDILGSSGGDDGGGGGGGGGGTAPPPPPPPHPDHDDDTMEGMDAAPKLAASVEAQADDAADTFFAVDPDDGAPALTQLRPDGVMTESGVSQSLGDRVFGFEDLPGDVFDDIDDL